MYQNDIDLQSNFGHLNITNDRPSSASPNAKLPPEIPPKPKKSHNINNSVNSGNYAYAKPQVASYYAVNAPAPGAVGMATARLNRGYSEAQDQRLSQPSISKAVHSQLYANTPGSLNTAQQDDISRSSSNIPLYQNEERHAAYQMGMPINRREPEKAVYSNLQPQTSNLRQPSSSNYASFGADEEFPPPPTLDDTHGSQLVSPPSPVSSSYSELHTIPAHKVPNTKPPEQPHGDHSAAYPTYSPQSHMSSTYESIYEPISPRPDSQMSQISSRGGYDPLRANLYGPYSSPNARGLAPAPSAQPLLNPDRTGKEAEVDALANLLVHSMDSTNDPEFFGICAQCGDRVVGEGSGCTAMEQVYHIQCFCCAVCFLKLQGKPFYDLEKKPYCQDCYLNTLEKCSVCTAPILDRILRATGKPYHPGCFTCVVCFKSLDGIPFTVDASNQIHCIDDFHKKFAPRCSVCSDPIMPETGQDETVRVVALDRSFHVKCYKCEDCGLVLSSEAEGRGCYPLDGHVLCKSCNAKRVQALTSKVTTEL